MIANYLPGFEQGTTQTRVSSYVRVRNRSIFSAFLTDLYRAT